jgi:purine-nucleoside phosphorylase
VAGHGSTLVLARLARRASGARLALVHGRPHRYEGWSQADLERAVADLAAWGVGRFLLLNACGGLTADLAVGDVLVATELIDLQEPPDEAPPRLPVCDRAAAARVAAALGADFRSRVGVYVAVPGPQYETPAEAAWLAGVGDVVGMSTAPEVRAAGRAGAGLCLLSLVVNRAAAVGSHAEVLATAARFRSAIGAALEEVVLARWPELAAPAGPVLPAAHDAPI